MKTFGLGDFSIFSVKFFFIALLPKMLKMAKSKKVPLNGPPHKISRISGKMIK